MDIFVGVNNKTGQDLVRIWDAGTGANISPSTTSVAVPTSQKTYADSSSNYSFDNVDSVINNDTQGNTLNTDLDADGTTDRLLSFSISFADVVSGMSRLASINITDASLLRFVLATSTEQNALNEDLNGVSGGVNSTTTWTNLGGLSNPVEPLNLTPEPGTLTGFLVAGALVLFRRRVSSAPYL